MVLMKIIFTLNKLSPTLVSFNILIMSSGNIYVFKNRIGKIENISDHIDAICKIF